jgi:hypothetical protein
MPKRIRLVVSAMTLLVICGAQIARWPAAVVAAPALTDLRGVDELKGLFNRDRGKVRLVLLVSPT